MIIFLHGQDTFRSRRQLKKMMEKFKADRDPQGLNVSSLDCGTEDLGNIISEVLAMPFLAEKRMIVLQNLLSATGKQDLQKEILKRIEEKTIPETNILVIWEGKGKPKTKVGKELLARLMKEKYAQEFEELKGVKLSAWISSEIKERKGIISKHALDYLANNVGSDMWRMDSLISQLIAYKQEGEIEIKDVEKFIEEKIDDNIFNLVDAIVGGQTKQVYKMIREQYRVGKDPHYVFAMLLRQFRILLEMRDLFDRQDNITSDVLAKKLGIHPFVAKKSLPFIKRYSMDKLKSIYSSLLDFDVKIKTGQGDPLILLDLFVGRIVS